MTDPALPDPTSSPSSSSLASLVTERLRLVPLRASDADRMLSVYADARMYVFTGGSPPDRDQLRARYIHLAAGWNHDQTERWSNWIVMMHDSAEPVGAMQASVAADRTWAAIAWEVAVPMQGRGIASEAAIAVVGWLREIGVHTIRASIHPDHTASAGVARRAGLIPTGEWDDGEIVWHLGVVS